MRTLSTRSHCEKMYATKGRTTGSSFALIETRGNNHRTPSGAIQRFQFIRFQCA